MFYLVMPFEMTRSSKSPSEEQYPIARFSPLLGARIGAVGPYNLLLECPMLSESNSICHSLATPPRHSQSRSWVQGHDGEEYQGGTG